MDLLRSSIATDHFQQCLCLCLAQRPHYLEQVTEEIAAVVRPALAQLGGTIAIWGTAAFARSYRRALLNCVFVSQLSEHEWPQSKHAFSPYC